MKFEKLKSPVSLSLIEYKASHFIPEISEPPLINCLVAFFSTPLIVTFGLITRSEVSNFKVTLSPTRATESLSLAFPVTLSNRVPALFVESETELTHGTRLSIVTLLSDVTHRLS